MVAVAASLLLPLLLVVTACSSGAGDALKAAGGESSKAGGGSPGAATTTATAGESPRPSSTRGSASGPAPGAPSVQPLPVPVNVIGVVGSQWQWAVNYPAGPGNPAGPVYEAAADGAVPVLYLPQGETVRFEVRSADVLHSLYIPSFLYKLNAVPGVTKKFEFVPQVVGEYEGRCAELCGTGHSEMRVMIKIVTPEEYREHLSHLKAQGQTGVKP